MSKLFKCADCGRKDPTTFILRDSIWNEIADKKTILCFLCAENRLERFITFTDLKACHWTEVMKLGAFMVRRNEL